MISILTPRSTLVERVCVKLFANSVKTLACRMPALRAMLRCSVGRRKLAH